MPTIQQQQQQQQVYTVNSTASSPVSTGSINRPPMSSQRTHPGSTPASPTSAQGFNNVVPAHVNSSFSSAGSTDVNGAIQSGSTANGSPSVLEPNGYGSPGGVAVAGVTVAAPPMDSSTSTSSASRTTGSASQPGASPATVTAGPLPRHHHHHHHHQHSQSTGSQPQTSSVSESRSGTGTGTTRSTTSRKNRTKDDASQSANGPRPSATVLPAPTPAMHWSRARVHGQIPPKELRAQTVNLVGESVYVFGGCDTKSCFNTLYIFDAGNALSHSSHSFMHTHWPNGDSLINALIVAAHECLLRGGGGKEKKITPHRRDGRRVPRSFNNPLFFHSD